MSERNETQTPNRLKEQRERSRLTQKEVAKVTGFDLTTISKHESGRGLSKESIAAYSKLYKVESYELFLNEDASPVDTSGESEEGHDE